MAFAFIASSYADSEDEEEEENLHERSVAEIEKVTSDKNMLPAQAAASSAGHVNKQMNFFGIESDSDSDGDDNSVSKKSQLNKTHSKVLGSSNTQANIGVALPNSDFWQGKTSPQLWDEPEKIWKHMPPNAIKTQRSKRHADETNKHQLVGYINKRAKNDLEKIRSHQDTTEQSSPLSKSCFFVHHKVQPYLHRKTTCHMPPVNSKTLRGHTSAVNRIKWNNNGEYGHLLLSVSMDRTVKIWNAFSSVSHQVQEFFQHRKAVKDGQWVNQGKQVITCGYDNFARLLDIEKGTEVLNFHHRDLITCIECHPTNPNYFMCGSLSRIICWDQRSNSHPVKTFAYKEAFGQVQDIEFVNDGKEFFICNDMVSRDSSDKNIMVWDFLAGVVLSNQVYHERYTCTRLKAHPAGGEIMAQTNGDYIALFSTVRPYKMNKCKRFQSHKVQGYNVGCDVSPDGQYVISGSAEGGLFLYDYRTSRVLRTLRCDNQVCLDVAWHPHLPAAVAASTWGGDIKVWS